MTDRTVYRGSAVVAERRERPGSPGDLRDELVGHLRTERDHLRGQWVQAMTMKGLLVGLTAEETETESATIYDTVLACLLQGDAQAAEDYAQRLARRGVLSGMSHEQILGGMLTLRDILGRWVFGHYSPDPVQMARVLDIYEPVANQVLVTIAVAFIGERERVVRQQQEAIRELSTPVLRVRDRMLILPMIGLLDSERARRLTEQLLFAIREHRAKVVVMDVTGVPAVDSKVANHIIQTVDAARLLGAKVIVTGLSPEIAQTIVTIGVDVARLHTMGDLQGGIELADRLLGYRVVTGEPVEAPPVSPLGQ